MDGRDRPVAEPGRKRLLCVQTLGTPAHGTPASYSKTWQVSSARVNVLAGKRHDVDSDGLVGLDLRTSSRKWPRTPASPPSRPPRSSTSSTPFRDPHRLDTTAPGSRPAGELSPPNRGCSGTITGVSTDSARTGSSNWSTRSDIFATSSMTTFGMLFGAQFRALAVGRSSRHPRRLRYELANDPRHSWEALAARSTVEGLLQEAPWLRHEGS